LKTDNSFSWKTFVKGLPARMIIFAFLGLGWDVLMTLLQQVIAGKLTIHALNPASAWMYLAYGGIPLFFYPVRSFGKRIKLPYVAVIAVLLLCFYLIEFIFGFTLRTFGIVPWDYTWYLPAEWTFMGIITWHPVFVAAWLVFVIIVDCIDSILLSAFDGLKASFVSYWKTR
jgi:hypothetical protein